MTVEKVSYAGNPERVTEEVFDCVWVRFAERKEPKPIASQVLQWVDWRLQGQLSRYLLGDKKALRGQTTFVPTAHRLATPLVALEPPGELNWEAFSRNCLGMGIKRVLILCEASEECSALDKEVRKCADSGLQAVVLGADGAAGRS